MGLVFVAGSFIPPHGFDLYAYWIVGLDPYAAAEPGTRGLGTFLYLPPIAIVLAPLSALAWEAVVVAWLGLQLAALWYIGRRWALALVLFPPVWLDIVYGNINILLAAVIVAGFRHPALWALALLTKVTPGVGLVWFLVRREWRALAAVAVTTGLAAMVSYLVMGDGAWLKWLDTMLVAEEIVIPDGALPIPLLPRVMAAANLVGWAGLTDRRWLVPVGVTLAMPVLWVIAFAPLVACWALVPQATADRIRDAVTGFSIGKRSPSRP